MESETNKKEVYIVEDDSFLGTLLSEQFEEANIEVTVITSGTEAVEAIKNNPPDLLLLDIFIPGINGIELLENIRNDENTKNIKVIIISNSDQPESRARAGELGARFVVKAMTSPGEIVEMAKEVLVN